MTSLPIVLLMVILAPIRGEKDYAYRWALADALVTASDGDSQLAETLTRIAWFEGGFRRSVARCEIRGDKGKSLGAFQIQPQSPHQAKAACSPDLLVQAKLARSFVERSADACPGNVGADRLAMYVSGTCARGLAKARERWAEPALEPVFLPPM